MSNPFAWTEFPFRETNIPENGQLAVQKAMRSMRGPVFFPLVIRTFNGIIPSKEWKEGGKILSDTYDGFVNGFACRSYLSTPFDFQNTGLKLTWSITGGQSQSRDVSLASLTTNRTGQSFMNMEIPFHKKAVFYWKIENANNFSLNVDFSIPCVEIRR